MSVAKKGIQCLHSCTGQMPLTNIQGLVLRLQVFHLRHDELLYVGQIHALSRGVHLFERCSSFFEFDESGAEMQVSYPGEHGVATVHNMFPSFWWDHFFRHENFSYSRPISYAIRLVVCSFACNTHKMYSPHSIAKASSKTPSYVSCDANTLTMSVSLSMSRRSEI